MADRRGWPRFAAAGAVLVTTGIGARDVLAQSNEELMAIIRQQQRQIEELSRKVDTLLGQAQAATAFLTGASATSVNYVKALKGLCGGTFTVYKESTGNTSLGNFFTAKCSQNFANVPGTDAVAFNVSGGSYSAVQNSTLGTGTKFVQTLSGTPVAGAGALAGINVVAGITATGTIKSQGFDGEKLSAQVVLNGKIVAEQTVGPRHWRKPRRLDVDGVILLKPRSDLPLATNFDDRRVCGSTFGIDVAVRK